MREIEESWPSFIIQPCLGQKEIDLLQLPEDTRNILVNQGVISVLHLAGMTDSELQAIQGIGDKTVEQIQDSLTLFKSLMTDVQEAMPAETIILDASLKNLTIISSNSEIERGLIPPFEFKNPEEGLTELESLICLGLLKGRRVVYALMKHRNPPIKKISQLEQIVEGEIPVRGISNNSIKKIRQALTDFYQFVVHCQEDAPDESPVIINVPSSSWRRETEKQWLSNNAKIFDFLAEWQKAHPGKREGVTETAREFQVSRHKILYIIYKFRRITNQPDAFKPRLPVREVIRFIKAWQEGNPGRVGAFKATRERFNFGCERIRKCLDLHEEATGEVIPTNSSDIRNAEIKRLKSLPPKEAFETIKDYTQARKFQEIFTSLSGLIRSTGPVGPREISVIFEKLVKDGFTLKRFSQNIRGKRVYYYFAHFQEKESIVPWLKGYFSGSPPTPSRVQS